MRGTNRKKAFRPKDNSPFLWHLTLAPLLCIVTLLYRVKAKKSRANFEKRGAKVEILRARGIKKLYRDGEARQIISYEDISIKKGEIVAITGESGCGKSTLLNILGLLDSDFLGEVYLFGKNIRELSERERVALRKNKIAFIFQDFNLIESLNALDNAVLPLYYGNTPQADREKIGRLALERVGLLEKERSLPKNLSGGQRQRVAVARAMCQLFGKQGLILADEPTASLDEGQGREVLRLFFDMQKNGNTLIIITHNKDIAKMCHREISL